MTRPVAELIGHRIAELLDEKGWTLGDLERNEGISYNTARKWLAGETSPTLGVLLHLVDVFELCSVEEILGGSLGTRRCRVAAGGARPAHRP